MRGWGAHPLPQQARNAPESQKKHMREQSPPATILPHQPPQARINLPVAEVSPIICYPNSHHTCD